MCSLDSFPSICASKNDAGRTSKKVYGEFIHTFTFGPGLPIVQPGGALEFPITTVDPQHVRFIDEGPGKVGLQVPSGTYRVRWVLNPGEGAQVTLLVNGQAPRAAGGFPYTKLIKRGLALMDVEHLVEVKGRKRKNLLSLVNTGTELITLNDIPNTRVDDTAVITQVIVEKID